MADSTTGRYSFIRFVSTFKLLISTGTSCRIFNQAKRAWAFWVVTNQSFSSNIGAGWSYGRKKNQSPKTTSNKRARFEQCYATRLEQVSLDCRNALEVIQKRDSKESFFYVDPPYFNADQ